MPVSSVKYCIIWTSLDKWLLWIFSDEEIKQFLGIGRTLGTNVSENDTTSIYHDYEWLTCEQAPVKNRK